MFSPVNINQTAFMADDFYRKEKGEVFLFLNKEFFYDLQTSMLTRS